VYLRFVCNIPRLCSPPVVSFQRFPKSMKYYFCTCLTLRGIRKKDDHKNFRGGECNDNLFPFFFLLVYFSPSIPFILIPLCLCELVGQRSTVDIWSKLFDCACTSQSLEMPSPCSSACCSKFAFHSRTWFRRLGATLLSYFSKSTLPGNWAIAEPILPQNRYKCAEIYPNLTKNRLLQVSTKLNILERHSRGIGSPKICSPSNGRARITGIRHHAMIMLLS